MANETRREKAIRKTTKGKNANYRKTRRWCRYDSKGCSCT